MEKLEIRRNDKRAVLVKVKKCKKSPAPVSAEQAESKSTIEILSENICVHGMPTQVIFDRGHRAFNNMLDRMQKAKAEIKVKKEFDIRNAAGSERLESFGGKTTYLPAFKTDEEKERASKIAKQLKGMTIREAQDFLSRVSDALIGAGVL
ncbi:MAG: hypothetical protein NC485_12745 [Ruminococcus flavefaciens]|nr:hypothetical protein [Ruminococcus flavefaciens]MCM1061378.1 hypothetical protein [Eubacterium sp.]